MPFRRQAKAIEEATVALIAGSHEAKLLMQRDPRERVNARRQHELEQALADVLRRGLTPAEILAFAKTRLSWRSAETGQDKGDSPLQLPVDEAAARRREGRMLTKEAAQQQRALAPDAAPVDAAPAGPAPAGVGDEPHAGGGTH